MLPYLHCFFSALILLGSFSLISTYLCMYTYGVWACGELPISRWGPSSHWLRALPSSPHLPAVFSPHMGIHLRGPWFPVPPLLSLSPPLPLPVPFYVRKGIQWNPHPLPLLFSWLELFLQFIPSSPSDTQPILFLTMGFAWILNITYLSFFYSNYVFGFIMLFIITD